MISNRIAFAAFSAVAGFGFTASQAADFANVVSATPLIVAVPVPSSQCTQVPAAVQPAPSGGGALVGGITGAAIGNAAAYAAAGPARAAATGIGLIVGSLIGNQVEADNTPPVATAVTQCQTVTSWQNRSIGYHVAYDYQGVRHEVDMAQAPGPQIAVDAAGNALVAAAAVAPQQPAAVQPAYAAPYPPPQAVAYPAAYPPGYPVTYVAAYPQPYAVAPWPVVGIGIGWGGGWRGGWHGGWRR